ncbi:Uncharacterised protein [Klebsiella pneumoniae]|nr:Uncharacterised protein [Klebsiella pneumoniae]
MPNTLAASGFKDMADNIQQNMGFLERAANAVGDAFFVDCGISFLILGNRILFRSNLQMQLTSYMNWTKLCAAMYRASSV